MRFDHLHAHQQLSRRQMLKLGAAAAGTAAIASTGVRTAAGAQTIEAAAKPPFDPSWGDTEFSDEMFELSDVPGWAAVTMARYGENDQIGTWNEVKPFRTRKAVQELAEKLVTEYPKTYPLGEIVYNGFPAFPSNPPRLHEQHLFVAGNPAGSSGAIQALTAAGDPIVAPLGPNMLTYNEDRFPAYTFQIATQTDGLNHVGVGTTYYNGVQFEDLLATHGTLKLGGETCPPIVTRGVILDIVGLKQDLGETNDLITHNGETMLSESYRITLSDIDVAMRRGRINEIRPGDVVLFYTGWTHLADQDTGDPEMYLASEPGIYLAETRYLAANRPAIVGGDSWGLEVVGNADVTQGNLFPCHQVLLAEHGIRIGEGYRTHELIRDNVFEFLFMVNPERSPGSTAGSTSPVGIGVPSNRGPESVRRR